MQPATSPPKRILSIKEVSTCTGLSRSTIGRLIKNNEFPKPLRLSVYRIGFLEADVLGWIDAKVPRTPEQDANAAARGKPGRGSARQLKTVEART